MILTNTIGAGQAAQLLGVTVKTLLRWEREGRLLPLALLDAVGRGEVAILVLAHRDRLTHFGFDWFAHNAHMHACELLVLNQEWLSPEQEMVQDLMTILHCFSSRLYGLRNYRRQLQAALDRDFHAAGAPDQD